MAGLKRRRTGPLSSKRQKLSAPITSSSRGSTVTLKKAPRIELRRQQFTAQYEDLHEGGYCTTFGTLSVGDNNWQREGRVVKHLYFQWHVDLTKYANIYPNLNVRVIFGLWYDNSNPVAADILGAGGVANAYIKSDYNLTTAGEYKILSDKLYNLSSQFGETLVGIPVGSEFCRQDMGVIKCPFEQRYGVDPDPSAIIGPRHFVLVICDRPFLPGGLAPGFAEVSCSNTFVDI